jgi:hypothetical protein
MGEEACVGVSARIEEGAWGWRMKKVEKKMRSCIESKKRQDEKEKRSAQHSL